ncbi:MAG: flavin reductase family protein [Actinomycetota bacterium]|nr:flavin reductase family protein [Actinomycetota bacterium]
MSDDALAGDRQLAGPSSFDTPRYRTVLGHFCTGVSIVTAVAGGPEGRGAPTGFTAQSFTSVSLEPPLVAMCPGSGILSWPSIRDAGVFCANILAHDQESLCRRFATRGVDKFQGVGWRPSHATGSPVIDGVLAWVDARIEAIHQAGDHLIVVGRVVDLDVSREASPLLFYRGGYGRFEP